MIYSTFNGERQNPRFLRLNHYFWGIRVPFWARVMWLKNIKKGVYHIRHAHFSYCFLDF